MKTTFLSVLVFLTLNLINGQADVDVTEFAIGLNMPVNIKHAGDDRLFVVEQEGTIRIVNADGSVNSTAFLNIESDVTNIGGAGDERGFLGLAFHPNYASNGFFYVNYTDLSGNTQIVRYSVDPGNPNIALVGSAVPIMSITQPFPNHNGGDLAFGNDGYLYISVGDGGSANDPGDRAQSLNTLLGKILRIDVDSGSPYAIPSDNPFANDGDANTLPEIWAYGLRNPWKMSFDTLNNDLWIADVGQDEFEEINRASATDAGLNYGWRCYEGDSQFNTSGCPADNTLTFPVGVYSHFTGAFKCSVTGGYRYRGSEYSNFSGLYFFADYCSGEVGYLEENGSDWDLTLETVSMGDSWSAFGEDVNGELLISDLVSGIIYRLVDNNLSTDDQQLIIFKVYPNPANNKITFDFTKLPVQINVFNIKGQLMHSTNTFSSEEYILDISAYSSGMYFVTSTFENGIVERKKLVVN